MGVFDRFYDTVFPYQYRVGIVVGTLVGGVPADPKVAEGWLKTKLKSKDDLAREKVMEEVIAKQMESGEQVDPNALKDAVAKVAEMKGLNVFWRDENGLYIEGRCAMAMLKEASNSTWPGRTWGNKMSKTTGEPIGKQTKSWFPEHFCVPEERIYLGRTEEDGVMQRFVTSRYGTSISQEAFCSDVKLTFQVHSDYDFSEREWAQLWLRAGGVIGIGASRSQQYGKFEVTEWTPLVDPPKKSKPAKAAAGEAEVKKTEATPADDDDLML